MEGQMDYETEQNRKLILPKLFRVWKTLNKMMQDRGYTIEEENFAQVTYEDWLQRNNDKATLNGIFYKMKDAKAESGIIIISGQLSPQAKTKLADINIELQVECFDISELMVNITEHTYVPKHILLTGEEKKQLMKRYKIKEYQLPKILNSDPVAKYLGLKRGDVVKIIRDSETAGKYVTYRITV